MYFPEIKSLQEVDPVSRRPDCIQNVITLTLNSPQNLPIKDTYTNKCTLYVEITLVHIMYVIKTE